MSNWTEQHDVKWRALVPFGVEIELDLARRTPQQTDVFLQLFIQHGLVIARRQQLSMQEQIGLMECIGPMLKGPDGNSYLSSEAKYGVAKAELSFHSDYAFTAHPIDALSLHAVDVVDDASSTRFASAQRAAEHLPETLRAALRAQRVEMVFGGLDATVNYACDTGELRPTIATERPCLFTNPRTGRECLTISAMHAARLVDMDRTRSRGLLHEVFDHLYASDNVVEHIWKRGDIVMWDNLTLHHARGSLESAGRRVLQRVAVGEKSLWEMYPELFAKAGAA